jgi:hypothetical protein
MCDTRRQPRASRNPAHRCTFRARSGAARALSETFHFAEL